MQSKGMTVTGIILSTLPVLMMLGGAIYGLAKPDEVKKQFDKYEYPAGTLNKLVIVELMCIVLYVAPPTAVLGCILLTGYLGGATATHVRAGEPWFMPVIVGIVLWLGLFFRDPRVRSLVPFRSRVKVSA